MQQKIKAQDTIFGEFHKIASVVYSIPSLQRPYTWERKEVEKLWDDIMENPSGYYIGSIVAIADGGTTSRDLIIDGQQRLTTLSLMLAGFKKYISNKRSAKFKILEEDIEEMLIKYSRNSKQLRLAFSDENSNKIYESIVHDPKPQVESHSNLQKKFIKNTKFIDEKIKNSFPKCKISDIRCAIDKIKNLQLIFIKCTDRSSAFNLFESINATGVSLATTDLLKNAIFEALHDTEKEFKFVEEGWKKMFHDFSEDSNFLKTYIRHHWISTQHYVSHANLFDSFINKYKDNELDYAKSLFTLSSVYLALRNAQTESLSRLPKKRFEIAEAKEVLTFLSFLGVDQVYSVLLYIYQNNTDRFIKDLNRLTAFQFLYKYIPGSPSVPEKKYFASYCEGGIDKQELFNGLYDLCKDQEEQFVRKFIEKVKYVEGKSGEVQFILEKLIYKNGGVSKFAEPTIEHIVPQDDSDEVFKKFPLEKDEIYRLIHQVGNLTVVERSENSDTKIFNQNLRNKFSFYKTHSAKLNQFIEKYDFLSQPKTAIIERGHELAVQVYNLFLETLRTGKWK